MEQINTDSSPADWVTNPSDISGQEIREVCAHAGLALYLAQCLEHEIVNVLGTMKIVDWFRTRISIAEEQRKEFEEFVDRTWDESFQRTFGKLLRLLAESGMTIPVNLDSELSECLAARNFLVHDFFRERAEQLLTAAGRESMAGELRKLQELFSRADHELHELTSALRLRLGISEEKISNELEKIQNRAKDKFGH